MYKSFEVTNFRCFDHLKVDDLERVNLIAGLNNVGKTALLEALFLHCGTYNPELSLRLCGFRGIQTVQFEVGRGAETPWNSLFSGFDASKAVELTGDGTFGRNVVRLKVVTEPEELARIGQSVRRATGNIERISMSSGSSRLSSGVAQVLELEHEEEEKSTRYYLVIDRNGYRTEPIPPAPPFPAFFQGARMQIPFEQEAERFGKLEVMGEEKVLLDVLRLIEPRLSRLAMVVAQGQPMLHGDVGIGHLVPVPFIGEGMSRLASLVLHIGNAKGGVVLVDEIENGLHHSVLPKVWQAIGKVARHFNTQVFATTHSLECISAAHKAFSEREPYGFRLHRLDRAGETIRVVTYDREVLEAAIETGLEVR